MVNSRKTIAKVLMVVLMVCLMAGVLTACKSSGKSIDTEGMILVVYDGTPGFLRNKTDHVRKLFVEENSKLPKYLDYYPPNKDSYTDPSLGLASFSGYSLLGWYLDSADAGTYTKDDIGDYVLLEGDNGVYSLSATGEFVYTYVENEEGTYVHLFAEQPTGVSEETEETEGTEDDFSAVKYVFVDGGFAIYDETDAQHQAAFTAHGEFTYDAVVGLVGKNYSQYAVYEEITQEAYNALYLEEPRYLMDYVAYADRYSGLDRFSLTDGYADINFIFIEDAEGNFVYIDEKYEIYDETNPDHVAAASTRVSINSAYKFISTTEVPSPSYLQRYSGSFNYWVFETDRVTKALYQKYCTEKGYSEEEGFLTLNAHWSAKPTVQFIYPGGNIISITTKKSEDRTKDLPLVKGETIGSLQGIPTEPNKTFVGWSKSATEYIPWDFANDVFPINTGIVKLYAYMIDGIYTRITTTADLKKVGTNLDGDYLLCNDIDLSNTAEMADGAYSAATEHPLGMRYDSVFTGSFVSTGCSIKNFTMEIENVQKFIVVDQGNGVEKSYGLFPNTCGATIKDVYVENCTVKYVNLSSGRANRIYTSYVGVLVGRVLGTDDFLTAAADGAYAKVGDTIVEYATSMTGVDRYNLNANFVLAEGAVVDTTGTRILGCKVTASNVMPTAETGNMEYDLYVGGILALGEANVVIDGTEISDSAETPFDYVSECTIGTFATAGTYATHF